MAVTFDEKNHSDEWKRKFDEELNKALFRAGLEAEGDVKDRITANPNVDTGLMRNSITFAISGEKANITKYRADRPDKDGETRTGEYRGTAPEEANPSVYVGTNVEYAIYQEMGARGRAPKPFLKPTITENADKYRRIIKAQLEGKEGS